MAREYVEVVSGPHSIGHRGLVRPSQRQDGRCEVEYYGGYIEVARANVRPVSDEVGHGDVGAAGRECLAAGDGGAKRAAARVVVIGNLVDGIAAIYGPFPDGESAVAWGDSAGRRFTAEWHVLPLLPAESVPPRLPAAAPGTLAARALVRGRGSARNGDDGI